jgi:quinol-cytochrome oxidoreductase complex cytochrome b subunit
MKWIKDNWFWIIWELIWISCFIYFTHWASMQPVRDITNEFNWYWTFVSMIPVVLLFLIVMPLFMIDVFPFANKK